MRLPDGTLYEPMPEHGFPGLKPGQDRLNHISIQTDDAEAMRVYLGLYQNETAQLCHWNINEAHYLESWSDARAYDGTVSLVQPLFTWGKILTAKVLIVFVALALGASNRFLCLAKGISTG